MQIYLFSAFHFKNVINISLKQWYVNTYADSVFFLLLTCICTDSVCVSFYGNVLIFAISNITMILFIITMNNTALWKIKLNFSLRTSSVRNKKPIMANLSFLYKKNHTYSLKTRKEIKVYDTHLLLNIALHSYIC